MSPETSGKKKDSYVPVLSDLERLAGAEPKGDLFADAESGLSHGVDRTLSAGGLVGSVAAPEVGMAAGPGTKELGQMSNLSQTFSFIPGAGPEATAAPGGGAVGISFPGMPAKPVGTPPTAQAPPAPSAPAGAPEEERLPGFGQEYPEEKAKKPPAQPPGAPGAQPPGAPPSTQPPRAPGGPRGPGGQPPQRGFELTNEHKQLLGALGIHAADQAVQQGLSEEGFRIPFLEGETGLGEGEVSPEVRTIGKIIIALLIIGAIFGILFMINPQMMNNFMTDAGMFVTNFFMKLAEVIYDFFWFIGRRIIPTSIFGVQLRNPLSYESCYPFCISESGKPENWQGFEITKLEVTPTTIYDYQRFSVTAEFRNKGSSDATFRLPTRVTESATESLILGCSNMQCTWNLFAGGFTGEDMFSCKRICPFTINQEDLKDPYVVGACFDEYEEFLAGTGTGECILEPQDTTQVRWYGLRVDEDELSQGKVINPEVEIELSYTFEPTTDLVGNVVVLGQKTQPTETIREERIADKVSESYSPAGPMMMALGTAEEEVVSGVPTMFLVQFANRGQGTVMVISKEDMRLYVPPEFEIMDSHTDEDGYLTSDTCDFIDTGEVGSDLIGTEFYPGDGYEEHKIFKPKNSVYDIEPFANPMDNPLFGCVFTAPPELEGLNTFTFKVRVTEYTYTESRKTYIKVIGTGLETVEIGKHTVEAELDECDSYEWFGTKCEKTQTIDLGEQYDNVEEIKVSVKRGGEKAGCIKYADVDVYAVEEYTELSEIKSVKIGSIKNILPQTWKEGEFDLSDSPISVRYIMATITKTHGGVPGLISVTCEHIDDMAIELKYTESLPEEEEAP